jgi:hypothetical protein
MEIKSLLGICCCVIALAWVGCGGGAPAPEPPAAEPPVQKGPALISLAQAFDTSYLDKEVRIDGYFRLPFSVFAYDRIPLEFYSRKGQRKGPCLVAKVRMVDSTNAMLPLPPSYAQDDIRILLDNGDTLNGDHRFRVTGRLRLVDVGEGKPKQLEMDVDTIRLSDAVEPTFEDLKPARLDTAMVNDSTRRHYLVVAEGLITIPSMMAAFQEYWVWLEGDHGKIALSFQIGFGANRIDTIPAKFRDTDVKIYDHQAQRIDLRRKVRVYGDYTGPDDLTTGDIYVEKIEQLSP